MTHADFAVSNVPAFSSKVLHPGQGQLAEIAVFHARRHERHGDIALYAVDSSPRRHQSHDPGNNIYQGIRRVVLVFSGSPEFIQACE